MRDDETIHRRIGKYEILEPIGHGGMGVVYLAHDPDLNRRVAIKVIHSHLLDSNPQSLKRFFVEAEAIAALQHPNIVVVYELGQHRTRPYIAMEYLLGVSLAEAIHARHVYPLSQKICAMADLCGALQHAHDRGVTHRDIKPANIRIDQNGRVKLLDFGIAKLADRSLCTEAPIGTPAYLAPEVARGEPADSRSDIFAIGVTLYEWLAFERPTQPVAIGVERPLSLPSDVPEAVCAIVRKAMAFDPSERYQRADEMERAFGRLQGMHVSPRDLETISSAPLRGRSARPMLAAVAAMLTLVL
jgi:serine/threonine-protein kinase